EAALATAQASLEAAKADVAAGEANVRRLEQMLSFTRIEAPFAGTVTERRAEVSALVMPGTGSGQALFRIARTDAFRVFVQVPQTFAPAVRAGETAELRVREFPGRAFPGVIARTAGALDPASRTLRVEVDVPNADRVLLAGMYAQVRLGVSRER